MCCDLLYGALIIADRRFAALMVEYTVNDGMERIWQETVVAL